MAETALQEKYYKRRITEVRYKRSRSIGKSRSIEKSSARKELIAEDV